jgi:hypothetical protein
LAIRDDRWLEAIAIGSPAFVHNVKNQLGINAAHRDGLETDGSYALREAGGVYGVKFAAESQALRSQSTFFGMKSLIKQRHSSVGSDIFTPLFTSYAL